MGRPRWDKAEMGHAEVGHAREVDPQRYLHNVTGEIALIMLLEFVTACSDA